MHCWLNRQQQQLHDGNFFSENRLRRSERAKPADRHKDLESVSCLIDVVKERLQEGFPSPG